MNLSNLNTATTQEVFDFVVAHLLEQNKRCGLFEEEYDEQKNFYHGKSCGMGSLTCAVGCLITDDQYEKLNAYLAWHTTYPIRTSIEGADAKYVLETYAETVGKDFVIQSPIIDMLLQMQNIHDESENYRNYDFINQCRHLAKEFGIKLNEESIFSKYQIAPTTVMEFLSKSH